MPGPMSSTPASRRHVAETAVVVAVEILAAEIVRYIEIGPAIAVVVAPGRREAEAVVVLDHAGFFCAVFKEAGAVGTQTVAKQKIRRAVLRVVVGRGIRVLRLALKIHVAAEVKIELAVAVEIGSRHAGESAARYGREPERVPAQAEMRAFVQKQDRTAAAQHDQILAAGIAQVEKERRMKCHPEGQRPRLR